MENLKKTIKKIWNFLWNDDSIWSWIISLLLAFIIVKFIFFPFLSLILGTSMPLVVVESGSMHHIGSFTGNVIGLEKNFNLWWQERGEWYRKKNITKEQAEKWPLKTGLEIGDVVIVYNKKNLKIGDIIIFEASQRHPVIHRIIEIKETENGRVYATKGDNNLGQLPEEKTIPEDAIIGKAVFRIPKIGWVKLGLVKVLELFY